MLFRSSARRSALSRRLVALGEELQRWRPYWSAHAFREPVLPWEALQPALSRLLRTLELSEVSRLLADPDALDDLLGRWFPVVGWRLLCEVEEARRAMSVQWPRAIERDVPGRKWAQVTAFIGALCPTRGRRVLDWCAGKAHLGRALCAQHPGAEYIALERDVGLVSAARALAARDRLPVRAECCDVMNEDAPGFIEIGRAHV